MDGEFSKFAHFTTSSGKLIFFYLLWTSVAPHSRLGLDSAQLGFLSKKLGSGDVFKKLVLKKWGLFKNSIWKSLILTKKKKIIFFLYNSPKGQFLVKRLVKICQKAKYRCYSKFSALNALQYI